MENIHFADIVYRQAEKFGARAAIRYRDEEKGEWIRMSWNRFAKEVMMTAKAMAEFGIGVQENIGLYSQNMPECLITDYAAYSNRAVSVPMYSTSSPAQVEYIVNDASISTLFVGEQLQYNNAFIVQKNCSEQLKRIVIFDSSVKLNPDDKTSVFFRDFQRLGDNADIETTVKIRMREALPDDIATIIYTSGTTGNPKGVVLHHYSFIECMKIHVQRLPHISHRDVSMCFLPLTHIFERAWSYLCIYIGAEIAINRDPKAIQKTLPEVRPTMMCNVPRFWEKVYSGVHDKIEAFPLPLRKIARHAISVGYRHNVECRIKSVRPSFGLRMAFLIYDKLLFNIIKRTLGIEKAHLFPVAGAPLSLEINRFLLSVNIPVVYGYGLSETTATVSFCPLDRCGVDDSVGKIMPGVEVRIDPDSSEILVKGLTVASGYYRRPDENERSFTPDGFLKTGDAGSLVGDMLYFRERIKDLYKTSNGKYIAPQAIEMLMTSGRLIAQIAVVGDMQKFVGALIVPDFDILKNYAEQKGIDFGSRKELLERVDIVRMIESHVEERQKDLASHEKIKRFVLLEHPFAIETGELTDTLKLRRGFILKKYADEIASIYS